MRTVCALLCVAVLATGAYADDDVAKRMLDSKDVRVRARVATQVPVYVGQKTEISFDLMTTSFFKGAPTWRVPDVAGAIARQESQFAVNGSSDLDGRTYATQTWTIAVYPQRVGTIRVPAIAVVMKAADGSKTVEVPTRIPAVSFEVRRPDGVTGDVIAATSFRAEAVLEGDTKGLKVGDALRRTIIMTIDGAPAMVIPPLPETSIDGVGVYPDPPRVDDVQGRGSLIGTRVESVSHVFERPGSYTLPAVRLQWFDLSAKALKEITLEAVTITVAKNQDLAAGMTDSADEPASEETSGSWFGAFFSALFSALFGAWAVHRYGDRVQRWFAERKTAKHESEAAHFGRLESACAANDAAGTMKALLAWIDRRAAPATGSLPAFVSAAGSSALADAVRELEQSLYAKSAAASSWKGDALGGALRQARRGHAQGTPPGLIRLNP